MKRLAIVGFGGAGYNAAKAARSVSPDAEIDVYTDTDVGPYNPMLTTYYVKNAIAYDTLFPFGALEEIAQSLRLNIHTGCPVTGLLAQERAVELANGTRRRYDSILLSTGASALMPPIPGIDLPGVLKMRTAADARLLKERIETGGLKDALVVGASWVGIKVIEDFYEKGIACTLVDGAKWIFPVAAFRETAQRIQADLDRKSVRQAYGQMLERIEREPDGRLAACMKGGERFSADTVVVCIGIRPNVGFLKGSGLEIGRAVRVDRKQQTNIPGIYAAGDCCEGFEMQSGTYKHVGVWANAQNQGRVAGINMAGGNEEFSSNLLLNLAHYLHVDFLSIGDITTCCPGDEVYEYEDDYYYIRGVKKGKDIKCINIFGPPESNGILRSGFVKSLQHEQTFSDYGVAALQAAGYPDSFIKFLGGSDHD
jgi:NADPH-dependent 2,4-dienoyl-CoA reductase/sulfur reductase-like enzyme